ncbi:MAG: metallophosphoesterase family protein [Thermodesulfobacteriota bacterium]|nr:metallophosphoesterase family protein [Thermodesulfobacteriota bacterium]
MKIGVISDTHLTTPSEELGRIIKTYFKDANMILHAGDIVRIEVLKAFNGMDLQAVHGNMDSPEIKKKLPPKRVIRAGRFEIGLIHGWGQPIGMERKVRKEFEEVDCIVFGHTHCPTNRFIDEILFFNPGSLKNRWFDLGVSVGILDLNDKIKGRIIKVRQSIIGR